jgi:hypothetical protein
MFTSTQRALITLDEFCEAAAKVFGDWGDEEGPSVSRSEVQAARDRASAYDAHSKAAHRSSLQAYMSGNKSDHAVAESHHDLADKAAQNAAGDYPDSNKIGTGFKMACDYHCAQAKAHGTAQKVLGSGRIMPSRYSLSENDMYGQPQSMY